MAADQLSRQLDWLASGRVRVVSLAELVGITDEGDAVALTFDDGFANFGEVAAPLLAERHLRATVFVSSGHVGGRNSWDANSSVNSIPHLPLLSWNEVRALIAEGFSFGGHGVTHRSLRGLDRATLHLEIDECSMQIEAQTNVKPDAFAFPYGDFDEWSAAAVAETFQMACTTALRPLRRGDSPYALPRIDMYYFRQMSIGDIWDRRVFYAYVKLRAAGRFVRASAERMAGRLSG